MLFVVLCPGTPEGSTGSGSGFKASQKTAQRLKVSSDRLREAGNRTCDPWFTRHRFIPYTTAACGRISKNRIFLIIVGKTKIYNPQNDYLSVVSFQTFVLVCHTKNKCFFISSYKNSS